jgi:GntR family transcriptional regulator, transcriptional repressor for pyruvate dehydrogenase complex
MATDEEFPVDILDRPPTLPDRVASKLLELISNAALKPGDRLPSERDLGDRFGVSRTVVREAIRSLAAKGVLDVRTGSGATVARVNVDRASEALRLYVQTSHGDVNGVTYEQINDVREMIEIKVARMAATLASDPDRARLSAIHQEFCAHADEPDIACKLDVAFHRAIAESVHNPLFLIMLDSIEPILLEIRRRVTGVPGRPGRAREAHGLILQAIQNQDPAAAQGAMAEHLAESRHVWRELGGERVGLGPGQPA